MQASNRFKKAFLKLMIKGLRLNGVRSKTETMSIQERKRAIKLSADAAMALARGGARWSSALISDLSNDKMDDDSRCLKYCKVNPSCKRMLRRRRSLGVLRRRTKNAEASVVARRLVKKRTEVLKRIIPGGGSLDDFSLLDETVDYVVHLRAQVNLMQGLVNLLGASNNGLQSQKSTCCNLVTTSCRVVEAREEENSNDNTGADEKV